MPGQPRPPTLPARCRSALKQAAVPGSVAPMWGICAVTSDRVEDAVRVLRAAGLVVDVEDGTAWVFTPS